MNDGILGEQEEVIEMLIGYKVKSTNNVIDMSFLKFKDKNCKLLIFEDKSVRKGRVILPFPRCIHTDEEIKKYNKYCDKGEEKMNNRYLVFTPIKNDYAWVIVDSDDIDIDSEDSEE